VSALRDGVGKGGCPVRRRAYLEHAMGSSQEPGTDCTTMLDSFTPDARSLSFVPLRRGSIIAGAEVSVLHVRCSGGELRRTGVPACVHDANAQGAAIVLLSFSGAFE
jgi:hypothetical protein